MTPAAPLKSPLSFKLLSLNTHKGFTTFNRKFILHELREAVRAISADIVFLQEVLGAHEEHSARHENWPPAPQYEFLADSIWTDFAYGRNAVYTEGHHGNAVLSKFPIVRHENHDISVGEIEKRGMLHCVLRIPGPEIELHLICVHLSIFTRRRKQQFDLLCDLVQKAVPPDAPLLIAGDFNDWQVRAHKPLARCGLKEAFVEAHGRSARTWPAWFPVTRLDRIYFRNARVFSPLVLSARPWSRLSDHAGVSAQVEI
jgi:endonuclease/exonuclease/phosphatase family metal-dependent hydrolase